MTSTLSSTTNTTAAQYEKDKERKKELGELIWKQSDRLQNLRSLAFQLGNYFFVFQGVILSSVSSSSSLTCSDGWFLATLSLLATIVNIVAVCSIGRNYIKVDIEHDKTWDECNEINAKLAGSQAEGDGLQVLGKKHGNDYYSRWKQYIALGFYVFILFAFSGVTLYCSKGLLCAHDHRRSKGYYTDKNDYCFKLCNKSGQCMFLCAESAT